MDLDDRHEFGRSGDVPASARTLWHGRFTGGPDEALLAYTVSLPFDQRMWADDIAGSTAHVNGLARAGLLTADEREVILAALARVADEMETWTFEFADTDEDIHTAIERRVTELAGSAGGKLHSARSRNDQVATDLRLWCRRELRSVAARLVDLQRVLLDQALAAGDTYLPGYTHLQRAQPVLLAHHLMAHGWALGRDVDRLIDALDRMDVSPLGAGALAGSSLPIDPFSTAEELGFSKPFENSLDAVSDRDFVAEALFALALVGVHLSRIGEEWVLWTSAEYGFAVLDDGFATGSSMLPQKKNPDIAELARGKSGRLIGNLTGLLTTLKGLPLAYNRDLQEDKEPLFDSVEQVALAVAAITGMIATATFVPERMQQAADEATMAATDLAEHLVRGGMPFREAHAIVGDHVRRALADDSELRDLVAADPRLGDDGAALVADGVAVSMRRSHGAGGPAARERQVEAYREMVRAETDALGL